MGLFKMPFQYKGADLPFLQYALGVFMYSRKLLVQKAFRHKIWLIKIILKKVEENKKKGLKKGEKFDIITYVAEKDGIKTENLKKVFRKL